MLKAVASGVPFLGQMMAVWRRLMNTDPWRFLILYLPLAWFLSTRYRNWEMSIIATIVVTGLVVFMLRKHPYRMVVYGVAWLVFYWLFVGFDPIFIDDSRPLPSVYTEVIAVNGSHRYERTEAFLKATGMPYHIQLNGPLEPVPNSCEGQRPNNIKYTAFTRLRLLELAEKHKDKDWLFVLEDDAEPVHSLKTFKKRFNHALTWGLDKEYDLIWLDYRSLLSGEWSPMPYGGITGILYRVASLQKIAETLEFKPEHCQIGTGLDEIWDVLCRKGVLKCTVLPILRENGQKTSLFVGLRQFDFFSD